MFKNVSCVFSKVSVNPPSLPDSAPSVSSSTQINSYPASYFPTITNDTKTKSEIVKTSTVMWSAGVCVSWGIISWNIQLKYFVNKSQTNGSSLNFSPSRCRWNWHSSTYCIDAARYPLNYRRPVADQLALPANVHPREHHSYIWYGICLTVQRFLGSCFPPN